MPIDPATLARLDAEQAAGFGPLRQVIGGTEPILPTVRRIVAENTAAHAVVDALVAALGEAGAFVKHDITCASVFRRDEACDCQRQEFIRAALDRAAQWRRG